MIKNNIRLIYMDNVFEYLNNSKIFGGCTMLIMNIGGRYISTDIPKSIDRICQNVWIRRFVIFCIAFIATRDIKISIFITLLFIILFSYLLHEDSTYCILPESYIDFNNDGKITPDEVEKAKKILEIYQKQRQNNKKI